MQALTHWLPWTQGGKRDEESERDHALVVSQPMLPVVYGAPARRLIVICADMAQISWLLRSEARQVLLQAGARVQGERWVFVDRQHPARSGEVEFWSAKTGGALYPQLRRLSGAVVLPLYQLDETMDSEARRRLDWLLESVRTRAGSGVQVVQMGARWLR